MRLWSQNGLVMKCQKTQIIDLVVFEINNSFAKHFYTNLTTIYWFLQSLLNYRFKICDKNIPITLRQWSDQLFCAEINRTDIGVSRARSRVPSSNGVPHPMTKVYVWATAVSADGYPQCVPCRILLHILALISRKADRLK